MVHTHSFIYHQWCIMFFYQHFSFPCQYHSSIAPYSIHPYIIPAKQYVILPTASFNKILHTITTCTSDEGRKTNRGAQCTGRTVCTSGQRQREISTPSTRIKTTTFRPSIVVQATSLNLEKPAHALATGSPHWVLSKTHCIILCETGNGFRKLPRPSCSDAGDSSLRGV